MDLVSKTPDENSGWKATDTSGIGRANSAPTPGSAILQSGIVAQSFGGQGDPSAISIIGEALNVTDAAAKCTGAPISATSSKKSPRVRKKSITRWFHFSEGVSRHKLLNG